MENEQENFKQTNDFRLFLQQEYQRRLDKNKQYSLRAFAKFLDINPGCLSVILKGKRPLTLTLIKKFSTKLSLEPKQVYEFTTSFKKGEQVFESQPFDIFKIMSEWHYGAICELLLIDGFKPDSKWIAGQLGLSVNMINISLERLFKYEFIVKDEKGNWQLQKEMTDIEVKDFTTVALKKLQQSSLNMSLEALENIDIKHRYHGAMIMAMDKNKLNEAKVELRKFRQEFCLKFQNKNKKYNAVYQLQLGFFPLTQNLK